jgi:DNA-binding FadR family transcriptional regulator
MFADLNSFQKEEITMVEREFSQLSEFMRFLATENTDGDRLPSLANLSEQLGVSIASLREQLEVARALGLVVVQPKKGIRRQPYQFTPAVCKSLAYASAVDPLHFFHAFADLRTHVETSYWHEAVQLLTAEDRAALCGLIERAQEKLAGNPIQIPHAEHRELHLSIYRRLNNPFVTGILEAYWEAYEAVGLNMYADIRYLKTVWEYHRQMVEAISNGNHADGYRAMIEHTDLLELLQRRATREELQPAPGSAAPPKAAPRRFE